jgi:hypothetical protein
MVVTAPPPEHAPGRLIDAGTKLPEGAGCREGETTDPFLRPPHVAGSFPVE